MFRFAPDVVLQVVDEEALLLKLDREQVFALNQTGARIAELIAAGHELPAVTAAVVEEYPDGASEVERAVYSLVETLLQKGLHVVVEGPSA
jgi:hypothetical protein